MTGDGRKLRIVDMAPASPTADTKASGMWLVEPADELGLVTEPKGPACRS